MTLSRARGLVCAVAMVTTSCGGRTPAPAAPSGSQSFLAGTWQGTVTIQAAPGTAGPQSATVGATTWTFEVVPGTNLQTFKTTIRSQNPWLPVTTVSSTAIVPVNTPPAQISTQGDYDSPRGCRGTFGSFGTADTTRLDADFGGVDCDHVTFTGRVALTKQ
jgi:hypothetical protein